MRFHGLDLNLLIALDVVLSEKNISAAAEKLNMSQPAVSGLMRRLRDYFQDDLLVPAGRRMILTPRGEALVGPVREVLLHIDSKIARATAFEPRQMDREVSIIASDYVVTVLLAPALSVIAQEAPFLRFRLKPLDESAVERLNNGDAELLLVSREHGATDCPTEDLFTDDFVLVGWRDNPFLTKPITLEDYQTLGHVSLQLGHGSFRNIEIWLRQNYGIVRRIEVTAPTFSSIPFLVVGTNRVATLPRRLVDEFMPSLPLKILDLPFDRPASTNVAQWHRSRDNDLGLRWLVDRFKEVSALPRTA